MAKHALKVAIVGTGAWWGWQHARVFSERQDVDLCAIVGRNIYSDRKAFLRLFTPWKKLCIWDTFAYNYICIAGDNSLVYREIYQIWPLSLCYWRK